MFAHPINFLWVLNTHNKFPKYPLNTNSLTIIFKKLTTKVQNSIFPCNCSTCYTIIIVEYSFSIIVNALEVTYGMTVRAYLAENKISDNNFLNYEHLEQFLKPAEPSDQ